MLPDRSRYRYQPPTSAQSTSTAAQAASARTRRTGLERFRRRLLRLRLVRRLIRRWLTPTDPWPGALKET
ncbi:hypothetical protein GCM10010331_05350 [Streptomyces xanthochromogenes]|nr:hypothetical protein GCM10010331_05350 [Streptomyces xanthochromogenes]